MPLKLHHLGCENLCFFSQSAASRRAWVFSSGTYPRGKTEAFFLKSTLFKNRKERTFSQKFSDSSLGYLFKWIPIRYNIHTNLTNNVRCRHENERYAEAICHLLPQVQIHRQGREHRESDRALPPVHRHALWRRCSGKRTGLRGRGLFRRQSGAPAVQEDDEGLPED